MYIVDNLQYCTVSFVSVESNADKEAAKRKKYNRKINMLVIFVVS